MAWLGAVTCFAGAAEDELLTGIDYIEPADLHAEIQWRETWRDTHQATMSSWQAELAEVAEAEIRRQRERARELRLLHALSRRFADAPQRDAAVMHQAVLFEQLAPRLDRGLRLLASRVDAVSDEPGRAVTLLTAMHTRAAGLRESGDWPAFIARRLLELHEAGHSVDEVLLSEALRRWFAQLQSQGRYFAARDVLRTMDRVTPSVRIVVIAFELSHGDIVWQSPLATQATTIQVGSMNLDTIHFGNRVAVADAAVYVSTGAGVHARLDARDGLIEWLQWYPRAPRGEQRGTSAHRLGAEPQVVDDVVVLTPRDRSGVLAVDRATGTTRWHRKLVDAIGAAPVAHAGRGHVAIDRSWLELDMATGEVMAQHDDVWSEPVMMLTATDRGVVALTAAPVTPPSDERQVQGDLGETTEDDDLYPFVHAKPRPHAMLWPAPTTSKSPVDFVVYGGGWLERVDGRPRPHARRRRPVPMGLLHTHWCDEFVVLVFADRAVAVDLNDGSLRWQTRLPFLPDEASPVGDYLLLGRHTDQLGFTVDRVAGLEFATGQVAWDRPLYLRWTPTVMWEGEQAYALTRGPHNPQAELWRLDLHTGAVCSATPFYHDDAGPMTQPEYVFHAADAIIVLAADKQVYEVQPDEPPRVLHYPVLPEAFEFGRSHHATELHLRDERWIEVRRYHGAPHQHRDYHQWLFDRHDPKALIQRTSDGRIFGNDLYENDAEAARLTVFSLLEQRELATVELPRRDRFRPVHLVEAWREDGRLYTLSTSAPAPNDAVIYLDVFDIATAEHLDGKTLAGARSRRHAPGPGQTRLLRTAGHFVLADAHGIYVFEAPEPSRSASRDPDDNI
ncbi:MAG: PQQ-binding-like beta-propeller repeat protein [Phycisphaeraceae bacterium]